MSIPHPYTCDPRDLRSIKATLNMVRADRYVAEIEYRSACAKRAGLASLEQGLSQLAALAAHAPSGPVGESE